MNKADVCLIVNINEGNLLQQDVVSFVRSSRGAGNTQGHSSL